MFSVVIPLYNKSLFIRKAIDSVFSQTFKNFEVIVVDDGSTDGGADIVKDAYGDQINLFQQRNLGVSVARNIGISHARYPWIAFLDADDCWSPFFLEKNWKIITSDEKVKIIGSHYSSTIFDLETTQSPMEYYLIKNYFKNALNNFLFLTSATVLKKDNFFKTPGFNPRLRSGEDLDVWFRINLQDGNAYYIKNTLVFYSNEDSQKLSSQCVSFEDSFIYHLNDFVISLKINDIEKLKEFEDFINKLIYESLKNRYFLPESYDVSRKIFNLKKESYFWADLYYKIPFVIGNFLVNNPIISKYIRKYFKFLFRVVYR